MGFHPVVLPLSWLSGVLLGIGGIDPAALAGHTVLLAFVAGVAVASSRLEDSHQPGRGMVADRPDELGSAGTWGRCCTSAVLEDGFVEGIDRPVRQPVMIVPGIVAPHEPGQLLGQRGLEPEQRSVAGQAGLVPPVHAACSALQPAVAAGFQVLAIGSKNWSSDSWAVQMAQCTSAG